MIHEPLCLAVQICIFVTVSAYPKHQSVSKGDFHFGSKTQPEPW